MLRRDQMLQTVLGTTLTFKDSKDPLKLVIVRDMRLTGFDAPCCHTMYVDKPMAVHNLMQAIARVNRVFAGKEGGLVVDYIGISAELKNALKTYTDAKGKGTPTLKAEKALDVLLEKLDVLRGLFHGFDYSKFEGTPAEVLALLPAAANVANREWFGRATGGKNIGRLANGRRLEVDEEIPWFSRRPRCPSSGW